MDNRSEKFKDRVYRVVKNIPKGKVLTYKQVAELSGSPLAYRAVGTILSNNYNPLVPCHRVIKSNGDLGEYNRGKNKKVVLLKKEGYIYIKNKKTS
ncbi:MAG: MGMT family protein [Candidatus Pacebacteria bacterium]|nr:MGMT family protein [Candidatus Paceibacterota bacterium]MBP9772721.1 MGMT family protein [Candidatus Paceibacterota bacterium]